MRALRAELIKLVSLPSGWVALIAGLVIPTGICVITSLTSQPGPDTGFSELAIGVLGAIVLGVVAIGSEYTTEGEESAGGRQITTTLTAIPSRTRLMIVKIITVMIVVTALAIVAVLLAHTTVHLLLGSQAPDIDGETLARAGGAVAYWVMMALLGFGLTVLTRNGIVPMAVLVANSSAVTVTFLLAQNFPVANYLPDLAGMRMFTTLHTSVEINPVAGGFIMAAWVAAMLVAAGIVFVRRDA